MQYTTMNLKVYFNKEHHTNFIQVLYGFSQFLVLLFLSEIGCAKKYFTDFPCGKKTLIDIKGTITSPMYPDTYRNDVNCIWEIHSSKKSVIELRVLDLDLLEDMPCAKHPCCSRQWLLLPTDGGKPQFLCGSYNISKPIVVSQTVLSIKYFSSNSSSKRGKRGFKIIYEIKQMDCTLEEVKCTEGKCIPKDCLCNGINDCRDGSDESNCSQRALSSKLEFMPRKILGVSHHVYDVCTDGKKQCKLSPEHCYSLSDECDEEFDCPNGEDEVGCSNICPHNQIACSSGGCYYPNQRCNYKRNCKDNSDETGCPPEPCMALQFTCLNGACVPGSALCDGDDDCGDLSDEENCTKSSFMTAAIMGLFSCIFLFCIGLSCLYRVYTSRLRASTGFAHQLESEPIDDEFIYREPPPAYSVAIGDTGIITYSAPQFMERYFEPDPHTHPSRTGRYNRRRPRSARGYEHTSTPRSRPRPSSGLTMIGNPNLSHYPDVSTQPTVFKSNHKAEPTSSRSDIEGVIELLGFPEAFNQPQENNIQGTYHTGSPCSSPSLSPSRESVTSSTSLEEQEDLVESCQS